MKKYFIYILIYASSFYFSCENDGNNSKTELDINDSARMLPNADIIHDSVGASTLGTTGVIWSTTGSTTTSNETPNDVTAGSTPLTIPNTTRSSNTSSEKNNSKSGNNMDRKK